jgi:ubiquinone/menaquinone biosynthesis C-methylase UbiE
MQDSANDTVSDWVGDGLTEHSTGELRPGFVVEARDIVLDVGCGGGTDSLFSAERGAEVIYVDVNPESIAETTRRLTGKPARRLTPIVSDCNPLPIADGTATKIVANEVMEHVDDPAQFLSELVRVGAPGALYLISVPDPALENMQIGLAAPSHFEKPNHIRIVGRDEFGQLVTDAGLTIERRGSDGFYWAIWWLMFWLCKVDIFERHPMLDSWEQTWRTLLETPDNARLRGVLNAVLPKSQYIVARKPGTPKRGFGGFGNAMRVMRTLLTGEPRSPARPNGPVDDLAGDPFDPKLVELRDAEESGWYRLEKNELFTGFTITKDDIVLDAGCGENIYAATCAKMGAEVIGRDSNPSALPDGSLTRVLALDALNQGDDPTPLLRELARVGKQGALYLLAVDDPVCAEVLHQIVPSQTIGRDGFEHLITASGLVVESVHPGSFYSALRSLFFQLCGGDPGHPLLTRWARTWQAVLDAPDGHKVKTRLDNFMPKTRVIVARKP